jgi:hypothetical protein
MVRRGLVAGEPDHTGLGWLSDNCNACSTGRPSVNLASRGEHVALVVDGEAKAKAAATPSEPRQRGKWSFPTGLTLRLSL